MREICIHCCDKLTGRIGKTRFERASVAGFNLRDNTSTKFSGYFSSAVSGTTVDNNYLKLFSQF